jgi:hypothetical protein
MRSAKRRCRKAVPSGGAVLQKEFAEACGAELTSNVDHRIAQSDDEGARSNGPRSEAVAQMVVPGGAPAGGRASNDGATASRSAQARRFCHVRASVGERLSLEGVELAISGDEGFPEAFEAFCDLFDPIVPPYIIVMRATRR